MQKSLIAIKWSTHKFSHACPGIIRFLFLDIDCRESLHSCHSQTVIVNFQHVAHFPHTKVVTPFVIQISKWPTSCSYAFNIISSILLSVWNQKQLQWPKQRGLFSLNDSRECQRSTISNWKRKLYPKWTMEVSSLIIQFKPIMEISSKYMDFSSYFLHCRDFGWGALLERWSLHETIQRTTSTWYHHDWRPNREVCTEILFLYWFVLEPKYGCFEILWWRQSKVVQRNLNICISIFKMFRGSNRCIVFMLTHGKLPLRHNLFRNLWNTCNRLYSSTTLNWMKTNRTNHSTFRIVKIEIYIILRFVL